MEKTYEEIDEYCNNNKHFYPLQIAECLGITEAKARQYFSDCKAQMKVSTNSIDSNIFKKWYYSKKKSLLPTR